MLFNCPYPNFLYDLFPPHHVHPCSTYPDSRVKNDDKGQEEGVVGSVSLLQNVTVSSQPISSMDWSPDKVLSFIILPVSALSNVLHGSNIMRAL